VAHSSTSQGERKGKKNECKLKNKNKKGAKGGKGCTFTGESIPGESRLALAAKHTGRDIDAIGLSAAVVRAEGALVLV
jgi:hypothetical protein